MSRPRVLLVDDDASIRRFVALALEDFEVDLVDVPGVPQAREALRSGPFQLIITDLMMPGETGFDLLQFLAEQPALRAGARLAVFSAGLRAETLARLEALDVWRRLPKPVSLGELAQCVQDAVGAGAAAVHAGTAATSPPSTALCAPQRAAVAQHFGGDEGLFLAYRSSCLAQFPADLRAGDAALAGADGPALRRLAHSLKSVLATLGQEDAGRAARSLEDAAARTDWPACRPLWLQLRAHLSACADSPFK